MPFNITQIGIRKIGKLIVYKTYKRLIVWKKTVIFENSRRSLLLGKFTSNVKHVLFCDLREVLPELERLLIRKVKMVLMDQLFVILLETGVWFHNSIVRAACWVAKLHIIRCLIQKQPQNFKDKSNILFNKLYESVYVVQ